MVFSKTLIYLLQKCEKVLQCKSYSHFFNVFVIFQEILTSA